jgi:hypothetical protein
VILRRDTAFDHETSILKPHVKTQFPVKCSPPSAVRVQGEIVEGTLKTLIAAEGLEIEPSIVRDSIIFMGAEYKLKSVTPVIAVDTLVGYKLEFLL